MLKKVALLLFTPLAGSMLFIYPMSAAAAPPAKMVKEVIDYFYTGQKEGPILTDARLCSHVKELNCEGTVDPAAVVLGETIKVWMQFFVPKGGVYDDIIVEYKHEGIPRNLTAHKVEGSIRYRLADTYKLGKTGNWTITIKKGITGLKEFNIKVIKK